MENQQRPPQSGPSKRETVDADQTHDGGFEVTPIYAAAEQHVALGHDMANEYDGDWVALPSNSFFNATKKTKAKVVATLVDEDTQPVTMVRTPELPTGVADAFADVPVLPYDEESNKKQDRRRFSSQTKYASDVMDVSGLKETKKYTSDAMDVSGIKETRKHTSDTSDLMDVSGMKETPPPVPQSDASGTSSNRGRRAFANFLKKRNKGGNTKSATAPSPRKTSLASAVEYQNPERAFWSTTAGSSSANRGRRTASKSPAPKDRARSLDDTGRIRNPNIAKKFSRLLKVYGNDINDEDRGNF